MHGEDLIETAEKACELLRVLSNPKRLLILCHLADGELSVQQIQNATGLGQSTVSQQLARLRSEGLVTTRRDGKSVYYSLASPEAERMIGVLYDLFCKRDDRT